MLAKRLGRRVAVICTARRIFVVLWASSVLPLFMQKRRWNFQHSTYDRAATAASDRSADAARTGRAAGIVRHATIAMGICKIFMWSHQTRLCGISTQRLHPISLCKIALSDDFRTVVIITTILIGSCIHVHLSILLDKNKEVNIFTTILHRKRIPAESWFRCTCYRQTRTLVLGGRVPYTIWNINTQDFSDGNSITSTVCPFCTVSITVIKKTGEETYEVRLAFYSVCQFLVPAVTPVASKKNFSIIPSKRVTLVSCAFSILSVFRLLTDRLCGHYNMCLTFAARTRVFSFCLVDSSGLSISRKRCAVYSRYCGMQREASTYMTFILSINRFSSWCIKRALN